MLNERSIRAAAIAFRLATHPFPGPIQILLDASLSMTSGDGSKEDRVRELASLLLRLSTDGASPGFVHAVRGAGRDRRIAAGDTSGIAYLQFDGTVPLWEAIEQAVLESQAGSGRVVISDFLCPGAPDEAVRRLAATCDRLCLVQLLDESELNPEPHGPSRLVDLETGETAELLIDREAVEGYRSRLADLVQRLDHSCRTVSATLSTVSSSLRLDRICTEYLVPARLLEPRQEASAASEP